MLGSAAFLEQKHTQTRRLWRGTCLDLLKPDLTQYAEGGYGDATAYLGRSRGWPGLAAFAQKPEMSMGMCALSWRSECGRSPDDVSRLELRACSMLIWRMVSEALLLMLSLAMCMSRGAQLVSILESASVTSSEFPPAQAESL